MLLNWKMILTVIIVLAVLAVVLANNPLVGNFFSSVFGRVGTVVNIEKEPVRSVHFSLALDTYPEITVGTEKPVNISITGETIAQLQEGRIQINNVLNIVNYKGAGAVGERLGLQGTFEKVEWPDVSIFLNGPITLNSTYSSVSIDGLALDSLQLDSSGTLSIAGTETRFSGAISLINPRGLFTFDRTNGTKMTVDGAAEQITIPSAGISVS